MNKMKLSLALVFIGILSGCTSLEKKFGEKVGCTEKETTVKTKLIVPAYSEYTVSCKNEEYTCRIAPFTEICSPADKDGKKTADKGAEKSTTKK